ncbi:hypothetical protein NEOKW01_0641 [Nematocida sp. AWRm80]|nr:hypothetical protein NEOKW01_0641 [Nematocida sp. AWRm80]
MQETEAQNIQKKEKDPLAKKEENTIQSTRQTLEEMIQTVEKSIFSGMPMNENVFLEYIAKCEQIVVSLPTASTISDYMLIIRHTILILIVRLVLLIRISSKSSKVHEQIERLQKERKIEMLNRNMLVVNGEIDKGKGILIESLFLNVTRPAEIPFLRVLEVVRILKNKIQIKQRISGREEAIDRYYIATANAIISKKVEDLFPITKSTTVENICEILEGIIEIENINYLQQIALTSSQSLEMNRNLTLNVKSVIKGLIISDSNVGTPDKTTIDKYTIYGLVLKAVGKYIVLKKREEIDRSGKSILSDIFDEDEIDMLLRLIERGGLGEIQNYLLDILIEGEIPLIKEDSITITPTNITTFIKYVIRTDTCTDRVLVNILSALEMKVLDDNEEALSEECNFVVVLDFVNKILKRYIKQNDATGISFQKYIGTSVLEVYNALIPTISNPLITCEYLNMIQIQIGLDGDCPAYFGSTVNRNLLLSRATDSIITAMKQISNFVIQGDTLYVDNPVIYLLPEDRCTDIFLKRDNLIDRSIQILLRIGLCLPDNLKVALASNHLMNILFRKISESERITPEILQFIRGFFGCSAVIQKIFNSISANLFHLIVSLIDRNEIETVYDLLTGNQRLYRGFFTHKIMVPEMIKQYIENPILYSVLSTLMIYYYVDSPRLQNESINKQIREVFDSIVHSFKAFPHIITSLLDTKELGYFFKTCCLLQEQLSLKVEDLLYVLMQSSVSLSTVDIKQPDLSILYKCSSKTLIESFFFYHFVSKGVDSLVSSNTVGIGELCLKELNNPFSSSVIKYISLLGLSPGDVKYGSETARKFSEIDLSSIPETERVLFVNQIYRALFLSGTIQSGSSSISMPINSLLPEGTSKVQPTPHSYPDMCIRSAIQATEKTGAPHTLPMDILSAGTPKLVAALLYTLYEQSPNSSVIMSYIKRMRKFVKEDDSCLFRALLDLFE